MSCWLKVILALLNKGNHFNPNKSTSSTHLDKYSANLQANIPQSDPFICWGICLAINWDQLDMSKGVWNTRYCLLFHNIKSLTPFLARCSSFTYSAKHLRQAVLLPPMLS